MMNEKWAVFEIVVALLIGIVIGSVFFSGQSESNFKKNLAIKSDVPLDSKSAHYIFNDTKAVYAHKLCIMSKVKSLSQYNSCNFVEWIEYHLLMGVSHFYVNNDCSSEPSFLGALNYYKQLGVLTVPNENTTVNCASSKPNENGLMRITFDKYSKFCEWVSFIDMDEFITLHDKPTYASVDQPNAVAHPEYHKVLSTLPELLAVAQFPFIRMPWWNIGSDGHEKRPKGLTINNYHRGALQRNHIKSIAKTSEVQEWWFQLYPFPKNQSGILFGNITRLEYVQIGHLHQSEYLTTTISNNTFQTYYPLSGIFLKHYVHQSWEEFKSQRAAQNTTAGGGKNIWGVNSRAIWISGYNNKYNTIAERFTSEMADKVLVMLVQRVSVAKPTGIRVFESCSKHWGISV